MFTCLIEINLVNKVGQIRVLDLVCYITKLNLTGELSFGWPFYDDHLAGQPLQDSYGDIGNYPTLAISSIMACSTGLKKQRDSIHDIKIVYI